MRLSNFYTLVLAVCIVTSIHACDAINAINQLYVLTLVMATGVSFSIGQGRSSADDDEPLTLIEAAKNWPGKRMSVKTIRRYVQDGCRGVRLKAFRVGANQFATTRRAIREFISALNSNESPIEATPSHQADEAELDALGV